MVDLMMIENVIENITTCTPSEKILLLCCVVVVWKKIKCNKIWGRTFHIEKKIFVSYARGKMKLLPVTKFTRFAFALINYEVLVGKCSAADTEIDRWGANK